MKFYKLEKHVKLFRSQFEDFLVDKYKDHRLDRYSMEMDFIKFRISYEMRNNIDVDIDKEKEEFTSLAIKVHDIFQSFLCDFLSNIIDISKIEDVLSNDIRLDQCYIIFNMVIISSDYNILKTLDLSINENIPFNIYPDKYFRFYTDSYNDGVAKAYPELFYSKSNGTIGTGNDHDVFVHSFTFQTTESCSLNCSYCYQFNKSPAVMEFDVAKTFIDNLLDDEYGYINRYNSPAIILEFIGGEPLLEIELTKQIYEYFLKRCYETNHPWFKLHRISLCSNGLQYFDDEVQSFFRDYHSQISFNISIDGNKKLHDSCRIQPNKEGSYDVAIIALNHYNSHFTSERNSKMTLAPSNISYLFESVKDFINNGMTIINLNCVFEEGWTKETALMEYEQLKLLADYILDNDLEYIYISIFNERQEDRHPLSFDGNFCGGNGSMLSMRPNGEFYPCIRYMPSSTNNSKICIGDVYNGLIGRDDNSPILKEMDNITRRSQLNDICFECPIANTCASCSAVGYTFFGKLGKAASFHCIQHIAEALANVYYFNLLSIKYPNYHLPVRKNVLPDEMSLLVIDKTELNYLKYIESYAMIIYIENDPRFQK